MTREALLEICAELHDFARYFVDAFCEWRYWRPCMSDRFDGGDWDWNSWSNGTIPGALALAARLTGRQDDPIVRENFLTKGAAWLHSFTSPRIKGVEYFRGARHWPNFSTNHGLVIYFSYFTGARLLGLWSEEDAINQRELGETLARSLRDGAYLEGLGYLRFALSHGVPHYLLRLKECPAAGWDGIETAERQALAAAWRFVEYATSAPDVPFANFGDNQPRQWNEQSFARLLAAVAGTPDRRLTATIGEAGKHTDAFSALALALPKTSCATPEILQGPDPDVAVFEGSGLVLAKAGRKRSLSLMFNASQPHKTHNKNNDFGGMVIARGKKIILRARPQDAMHFNNAVCGLEGGRIIPFEGPRRYGGVLKCAAGPDGYSMTAELVYPAVIQERTGLHGFRRGIFLFSKATSVICIASAAQTSARGLAAFCFDLDQDALSESGYCFESFSLDGESLAPEIQDGIQLYTPSPFRLPGLRLFGPRCMQTMISVISRGPVLLTRSEPEGQVVLMTPKKELMVDMSDIFRRAPINGT